MKLNLKNINGRWKEFALAGCVCILFYLLLANLGKIWGVLAAFFRILTPILLGFLIAYIINPMAEFFRRKLFAWVKKEKVQWTLSVVLTTIIVIVLITLLIVSLIPQIADSISSLAENYQSYVNQLIIFIKTKTGPIAKLEIVQRFLEMLSEKDGIINKIGEIFAQNAQVIINMTTSIGRAAVNWFIGAIFAIYFLMAKKKIGSEFSNFFSLILSPLKDTRMHIIVEKFNAIFTKYIVCEILDSLIVGLANYLFLLILNLPNALVIAVITGLTNLAPTFGPIVGAVLGSFIIMLVAPTGLLPFIIFTVIIQTLDAYVVKPKLFGGALNVPGVIILISIIVFGKLMGVGGMLIAIPAAAIIVYAYTEALIPWLELKKDMKQYEKSKTGFNLPWKTKQ